MTEWEKAALLLLLVVIIGQLWKIADSMISIRRLLGHIFNKMESSDDGITLLNQSISEINRTNGGDKHGFTLGWIDRRFERMKNRIYPDG